MLIKVKESLKKQVLTDGIAAKIFTSILKAEDKIDQDKEHFWAIGLNSRNCVKYIELVSLGILNASLVHPREVYRLAIMQGVAQILIAHNHPSGDTEPSEDDITLTHRLTKAGEILGIEIMDHIIIAGKKHFSFKSKGLIK